MSQTSDETKGAPPRCIGIIMDGNRRWARSVGLSTIQGHQKGYEKLLECLAWVKEFRIEYVIVYAFSTENWNRVAEEVVGLIGLMRKVLREWFTELESQQVRIRFVGDMSRFPKDLQESIANMEHATEKFPAPVLAIALSYGGRAEIVSALKKIPTGSLSDITEEIFAHYLWTSGIPDPDLIIRTGGSKRLSNFLPWQSVYSELYFTDTYWPALSKEEFRHALEEFASAKRNFGA
ncbi:MAG: polyprenyl diphosphate synthase [Patescibacteria group bacterium]